MGGRTSKRRRARHESFQDRYGSWALVAGASEGLGAEFALALARRGLNLVLVARRKPLLEVLARDLAHRFGIEVRCVDGDLAEQAFLARVCDSVSALDLGFLVYNAAYAPVGSFAALDATGLMRVVDVNARAPLVLLRGLLPSMVARGRGGVVLMSSLAGNQGAPRIATYAATKAFARVLAEGLWSELRATGVDVIACSAGAVRTPGYAEKVGRDAPGALDPRVVAERTLRALGSGPVAIPGLVNRAASWVMSRLLSRRAAIAIMAGSTRDLDRIKTQKEQP